jgi:hypothetical protein
MLCNESILLGAEIHIMKYYDHFAFLSHFWIIQSIQKYKIVVTIQLFKTVIGEDLLGE